MSLLLWVFSKERNYVIIFATRLNPEDLVINRFGIIARVIIYLGDSCRRKHYQLDWPVERMIHLDWSLGDKMVVMEQSQLQWKFAMKLPLSEGLQSLRSWILELILPCSDRAFSDPIVPDNKVLISILEGVYLFSLQKNVYVFSCHYTSSYRTTIRSLLKI